MSEKLKEIVNDYVDIKMANITKEGLEDKKFTDNVINEAKNSIISQIKAEVKKELISEAKRDAEKEIEAMSLKQRIKDYKTLLVSGVTLSLFLGLTVNQLTDLVSYHKGPGIQITATLLYLAFFLLLCLSVVAYLFISEIAKYVMGKEVPK